MLVVLYRFVYNGTMERILTVDEVAEVLRIKPFTVRQKFREKRLSGFKVGKAWRITESALQADIRRMRGGSPASDPEEPGRPGPEGGATAEGAPKPEAGAGEGRSPDAHSTPKGQEAGVGQLLIFSDKPGQEVFLDNLRRGITTLSLVNMSVGEHVLRVGEVTGPVTVYKDFQVRVRMTGDALEVLSEPPVVMQGVDGSNQDTPLETCRLRVLVEKKTDFSGEFCVCLTPEDGGAPSEMFAEHGDEAAQSGLVLTQEVGSEDATPFFDGTIRANPGDRLRVSAPAQPGLAKEAQQVYSVQSNMLVKLTLDRGGMFRAKNIVRFHLEEAPGQRSAGNW